MVYLGKNRNLILIKERVTMVLDLLTDEEILTWTQINKKLVLDEHHMSKTTLYGHLKELTEHGDIKNEKLGIHSYYFLPEFQYAFDEKEKELLKRRKPVIKKVTKEVNPIFQIERKEKKDNHIEKISDELRLAHSSRIQEHLIKKWINKIPIVYWDGVYSIGLMKLEYYYPTRGRLDNFFNQEENNLLMDFKNYHMSSDYLGNPFPLWDDFNSLARATWDKLYQFIDEIVRPFLDKDLELTQDTTSQDCYNFLIFEYLSDLWQEIPYEKKPNLDQSYWNHKRYMKSDISYTPSQEQFMATLACKDHFKKFRSKIKKYPIAEKNKEKIKEIYDTLERLKSIKNQLLAVLNNYLEHSILPGVCPILKKISK